MKDSAISGELIEKALETTGLSDETFGICLACFAQLQVNVPDLLAYRMAEFDIRSPRSIVVQRHSELHREAFAKRLKLRFADGFRLRVAKRERKLEYYPASPTLGRLHAVGGPLVDEWIPNVLGIKSQFQPLVDIWTEANNDLKSYDRAHRKTRGAELTSGMFEALPEYLQQGDHPHFDDWYEVMNRSVSEDGWTVVPIREFATLEGLSERKSLSKAQSVQLAATASHMGLALEPDPRITGRGYEWNELVSVFPATDELGQDIASYHAAAVLLELGLAVAAADGQIDESELGRLTSHLESQFDLSSQDSARLTHLRYLLIKQPPNEFSGAKTLQKKLTVSQRLLVGEFLVGIAAADEVIAPEEVKALGKAYRALGLKATDLLELLQSFSLPEATVGNPEATDRTFQLDLTRINSIMAESQKVTEFLKDALRDDFEQPCVQSNDDACEDESDSIRASEVVEIPKSGELVTPIDQNSQERFPKLAPRLIQFAIDLFEKQVWLRSDFDVLARKHGLMVGSAIEQLNDWGFDCLGLSDNLLVEENDEIQVQSSYLPKVRSS